MMDRRLFLGAGFAGASALTFSSVFSQTTPNLGAPTLPTPMTSREPGGVGAGALMAVWSVMRRAARRPHGGAPGQPPG